MQNKNLFESFSRAFEGFSHVLWTQRHVRIQLLMVIVALLLSYLLNLSTMEVLFVLSAVAAVIIAELFNTAIEVVVNMVTETYHPLAKIAKDVAASGVLMASIYALMVGGAIFFKGANYTKLKAVTHNIVTRPHASHPDPILLMLVAIGILWIIVALAKIRVGHGSILRGGAVSGHTAVAFLLFVMILIYSHFNLLVAGLALVLAILVAQSRVEGKIHSLGEVLWGAFVALILMAVLMLAS